MIKLIDFKSILYYCSIFKCRLILIGDKNQLPTIRLGNPFVDILNSQIFANKVTNLNKLY